MNKQKQNNLSTDRAKAGAAERQRRQAEALRANLARRKDQSRTRDDAESPAKGTCDAPKGPCDDGTDGS